MNDSGNTMSLLIDCLDQCEDYREVSKVDYPLAEILFLVFSASICGSETYEEIVDFGEMKLDWLRTHLPYKAGIPSHDTVGRTLGMLNTRQLEKALVDYANYRLELPDGTLIQIDGKRISGSATKQEQQTKRGSGGKQAVNMVNVFCSEVKACLSSLRVQSKAAEHYAIAEILELLELSNCVITLDAAYCRKQVASQIASAGADYLIGLKRNQPTLFSAVQHLFEKDYDEDQQVVDDHQEDRQKNRQRIEQRKCRVLHLDQLEDSQRAVYEPLFSQWSGLKSLIEIQSYRQDQAFQLPKNKAKSRAKEETIRYYICSQAMSARTANHVVRKHWSVENELHWMLDVVLGEDRSKKRAGNSAANYSILKKLAYNKLRAYADPKVSMRRRMKKCAMSPQYLNHILKKSDA